MGRMRAVPDPEVYRIGRAVGMGKAAAFVWARRPWRSVHVGHLGARMWVCPTCGAGCPSRNDALKHEWHEADLKMLRDWAGLVSDEMRDPEIGAGGFGAEVEVVTD